MDESLINPLNLKCNYLEIDKFDQYLGDRVDKFSMLSFNIRSINNKIDELQLLVDETSNSDFSFKAICLQEIWGVADKNSIRLSGYY